MSGAKADDTLEDPTNADIAQEAPAGNKNVYVSQKVVPEEDNRSATVTTSQYVTGGVGQGDAIGSDIVLLLDVSNSMNNAGGTSTTSMAAMQAAVNNFIDTVHNQSVDGVDNKVAVVVFAGIFHDSVIAPTRTFPLSPGGGQTPDANALQSMVTGGAGSPMETMKSQISALAIQETDIIDTNFYKRYGDGSSTTDPLSGVKTTKYLAPGAETETGNGVEKAYDILKAAHAQNSDRNQELVVFTDGLPGVGEWTQQGCSAAAPATCTKPSNSTYTPVSANGADTAAEESSDPLLQANTAIQYANKIKNELSATVFVAPLIIPATNSKTKEINKDEWTTTSQWDNDAAWETADITNPADNTADPAKRNALTKRFVELMSSNTQFTDPATASMTSAKNVDWTLEEKDPESDYLRFATSPDDLADMFSNMIPDVNKAGVKLDAGGKIDTYLSSNFQFPEGFNAATDIQICAEPASGLNSDNSPSFDRSIITCGITDVSATAVTDASGHSGFEVTGWNFADNYIGTHLDDTGKAESDTNFGSRLIVRYQVDATDDAEGDGLDITATTTNAGTTIPLSSITESGKTYATYALATMNVDPLVDNSWIPGCEVRQSGLCLGKDVTKIDDTHFTVTLSAYATGSVKNNVDTVDDPTVTNSLNISDFPTGYFTVPQSVSDIHVWQQKATGLSADDSTPKFYDQLDESAPNLASEKDVDVSLPGIAATGYTGTEKIYGPEVSNWPLATNYVGLHTDSATTQNYGKRLIIQFTETVRGTFLGGAKVPTNWTDMSGVTSDAPGSAGKYLAKFPQQDPVSIPLKQDAFQLSDAKAYLGGNYDFDGIVRDAQGKELTFPDHADGTKDDDFVNILILLTSVPIDESTPGQPGGSGTYPVIAQWELNSGDTEGAARITSNKDGVIPVDKDGFVLSKAFAGISSIDSPMSVKPLNLDPITIYTMTPQVSVKDSAIDIGKSTKLSNNVSWEWGNATKSADDLAKLPLASEIVTGASGKDGSVADVSINCVQGGCTKVTADTTASFSPLTNANFTVTDVTLKSTRANSVKVSAAKADALTVTADHTTVSNPDKESSFVDDAASSVTSVFDPEGSANFTVYVLPVKLSALPLTGGMGTGRTFLLVAVAMVLVAAVTATAVVVNRRRTR
ncbi:MAG: VWA domain-containing protein [Bifidobacteriaceae bacterium]|jgi:Mg-chelatase subunit ChlD|nr:VWA domain-containing protein [Bifidobacteriaceae bacterium]